MQITKEQFDQMLKDVAEGRRSEENLTEEETRAIVGVSLLGDDYFVPEVVIEVEVVP